MCAGKGSRKGGAGREKGRKEMRKHRPEAKRAQPIPRVSRSNGPARGVREEGTESQAPSGDTSWLPLPQGWLGDKRRRPWGLLSR